MTAPVYACARCGKAERAEDTFLCLDCLDSDVRVVEQKAAEATFPGDHRQQRRLLMEAYGWQGWSRRMGQREVEASRRA